MLGKKFKGVKNCLDTLSNNFKEKRLKDSLYKLLYDVSDEKFEYKLKKYEKDLIVPFFLLRIALIKAIKADDERTVYRCCRLKGNTDITEFEAWRMTGLADLEIASFMKSPMHFAAVEGSEKIIRVLARYYSVSAICTHIRIGINITCLELTPLHFASTQEQVKCLVELGADIEALSYQGTPFCRAAEIGNKEALIALYEVGANINYSNPHDQMSTPLVEVSRLISDSSKRDKYEPIFELLCEWKANPFMPHSGYGIMLYNKTYNTAVFSYLCRSIFADISTPYIFDGNLCIATVLKSSIQFNAIIDYIAKYKFVNFCLIEVNKDKTFLRRIMPDFCNLGMVCKDFSNKVFGTDFKLGKQASAAMVIPEEVFFYMFSQQYNIDPDIIQCIMKGKVVSNSAEYETKALVRNQP
jgi:hypothetical protein